MLFASDLGPLGWNEATWVAVGSIVSAAVAIASFAMAWFTRQLAIQTQALAIETSAMARETRDLVAASADERSQAERHHQQSMIPVVSIDASCSLNVDIVIAKTFKVLGSITNVGAGPALEVDLIVAPIGYAPFMQQLGPMAAASTYDLERQSPTNSPIGVGQELAFDSCTIYRSIFGTLGATAQRVTAGRADPMSMLEVILPSDGSEKLVEALLRKHFMAYSGPQPWMTKALVIATPPRT